MNVACQIRDTRAARDFPRIVFDADMHHDAERSYCEKLGIDQRNVARHRDYISRYYWLESQETSEEWDEAA